MTQTAEKGAGFPLSAQNRALLERKFGRRLPVGDAKVTLTLSALGKVLDAARAEVTSAKSDPNIQAVLDAVFGKTR